MLLDWAFRIGRYEVVVSSVRQDNIASHRMHSKFGSAVKFVGEGRDEIAVERDAFLMEFGEDSAS
jgi:RimJ/RimL family protein N-acetyltransferase